MFWLFSTEPRCVEVSTSKTGKHGHAKAHIVAIDIFTGEGVECCSHAGRVFWLVRLPTGVQMAAHGLLTRQEDGGPLPRLPQLGGAVRQEDRVPGAQR